jgi:hypothetical protein
MVKYCSHYYMELFVLLYLIVHSCSSEHFHNIVMITLRGIITLCFCVLLECSSLFFGCAFLFFSLLLFDCAFLLFRTILISTLHCIFFGFSYCSSAHSDNILTWTIFSLVQIHGFESSFLFFSLLAQYSHSYTPVASRAVITTQPLCFKDNQNYTVLYMGLIFHSCSSAYLLYLIVLHCSLAYLLYLIVLHCSLAMHSCF